MEHFSTMFHETESESDKKHNRARVFNNNTFLHDFSLTHSSNTIVDYIHPIPSFQPALIVKPVSVYSSTIFLAD